MNATESSRLALQDEIRLRFNAHRSAVLSGDPAAREHAREFCKFCRNGALFDFAQDEALRAEVEELGIGCSGGNVYAGRAPSFDVYARLTAIEENLHMGAGLLNRLLNDGLKPNRNTTRRTDGANSGRARQRTEKGVGRQSAHGSIRLGIRLQRALRVV